MIVPEGHVHDALMYRRIHVPKPGVEKTIEICACGATRKIERTPTSVLWDRWEAKP
jgi:hypothetical protein